jgi:hypothetical protein
VVAAEQPYQSALTPLAHAAGPLFFSAGPGALQTVYEQVLGGGAGWGLVGWGGLGVGWFR